MPPEIGTGPDAQIKEWIADARDQGLSSFQVHGSLSQYQQDKVWLAAMEQNINAFAKDPGHAHFLDVQGVNPMNSGFKNEVTDKFTDMFRALPPHAQGAFLNAWEDPVANNAKAARFESKPQAKTIDMPAVQQKRPSARAPSKCAKCRKSFWT